MNFNPIASIRQHLALKILTPLALLFAFASALGVAAIGTLFNQHLEQQLVDRGLLVALTLKDAAKSISSEKNLQNFVANLSQQKDIDFIIIAGDSPLRVIACSDDSLVGKPIDVLPKEDFINDLNSAINRNQESVEFDQGGGTLLDVSAPIDLPHLAPPHPKGALMIHLHTTPLKAATNKLKQQMSMGFLVGLGALLVALMLIIKQWILKPLHQILTTTDARNTGHKVFSQVSTQDEFLKLSNAFNAMVRSGDEVELQKKSFCRHG